MEEKIYGLIVQAQEMQKFALEFKYAAEDIVKSVPDAVRIAVRDSSREIIIEGTEKASKGLLEASRVATAAAAELREAQTTTMLKHSVYLILLAFILSASIYVGLGFFASQRAAELDELTAQAKAMQKTVEKLNSQYGKAMFSTCEGRPCVRVDQKPGEYGETKNGELYMVLFGY